MIFHDNNVNDNLQNIILEMILFYKVGLPVLRFKFLFQKSVLLFVQFPDNDPQTRFYVDARF